MTCSLCSRHYYPIDIAMRLTMCPDMRLLNNNIMPEIPSCRTAIQCPIDAVRWIEQAILFPSELRVAGLSGQYIGAYSVDVSQLDWYVERCDDITRL